MLLVMVERAALKTALWTGLSLRTNAYGTRTTDIAADKGGRR
jgi:hypothetical protein